MSAGILGRPVPMGSPIYPAPSGTTGVARLAGSGWQRVACYGAPGLPSAWRAVAVEAAPPPEGARWMPCPPRANGADAGALRALRAAVEADLPRRREEWAEACADVRMGWDGDEP